MSESLHLCDQAHPWNRAILKWMAGLTAQTPLISLLKNDVLAFKFKKDLFGKIHLVFLMRSTTAKAMEKRIHVIRDGVMHGYLVGADTEIETITAEEMKN